MQTDLDEKLIRVGRERLEPIEEPRGSRYMFADIAVASIWSPDMITGSRHEHLPIAAFTDWLYRNRTGAHDLQPEDARCRSLVVDGVHRSDRQHLAGRGAREHLRAEHGDGSDPTTIPIAAFASPVAGVVATAFASVFVAGSPCR